jgi:uncharacterized protein YecE (DUF72 family)
MTAPLFEEDQSPTRQTAMLRARLQALAERGIYFGTSSWKYEGWLGSIYSPDRYLTRKKFSKKKFEEECLSEYAETFPIVCGDFAFYQFPSEDYWDRLFNSTPRSFLFAFKVPETITVPKWPGHSRYGAKAGKENDGFLRADLFEEYFIQRLMPYRDRVAVLIFEFGTIAKSIFPAEEGFFSLLHQFLGALPGGFRYAVEIRNPEYLVSDYFSMLALHNVAHVFNAWSRMPEVSKQIAMPGAFTADFSVVRALLTKGRTYEKSVDAFEPYDRIQEPNPSAREALRQIAERAWKTRQAAYMFINNRLEGNAPGTIEAVTEELAILD